MSVRSAAEALAALAGGADVIDVKDPARGPLGAASVAVARSVVDAVAGRAAVTVAAGELADEIGAAIDLAAVRGVSMVKFGLSRLANAERRHGLVEALRTAAPTDVQLVPCSYADFAEADAPDPASVIREAPQAGFGWLLIDTWRKEGGGLFRAIAVERVASFVADARRVGVRLALAGQLRDETLAEAAGLGPALVGVRGAVCIGGRAGTVDAALVAEAKRLVAGAAREDDARLPVH
ncbi:MAG: (5-formylfuran-3-yl)methyl phosphate synthase [Lacipirellulaceae bacterium]